MTWIKKRHWCIEGCGRETGAWTGTGRRNPNWCPECDEKRIARISRQMQALVDGAPADDPVFQRGRCDVG